MFAFKILQIFNLGIIIQSISFITLAFGNVNISLCWCHKWLQFMRNAMDEILIFIMVLGRLGRWKEY
jgi:hypothetical protein